MSWIPPATVADEYDQWNEESDEDDARFLGAISGQPTPSYYVPEKHRVESGYIDRSGELATHPEGDSWTLEAEEDVGEFLERVGEEHGWDSLSAFAREHLEHEDTA